MDPTALVPLLVRLPEAFLSFVGEHERDVRGQQVVHLVAQADLAQQSTIPYQTADGHVEVVGTTTPVGDLCKWVYIQDFLEER